jgi:hypothetical protein
MGVCGVMRKRGGGGVVVVFVVLALNYHPKNKK